MTKMSRRLKSDFSKPALDLIEEATHLLRGAPAGVLLSYYIGSLPAALGLLYFFADMSRGAFARTHLVEASLGMAFLYLWMKCWQSVFSSGLHAWLTMTPHVPWSWGRIGRLVLVQSAIQPTGLFLRIIAAQILLPYIWVYGFYQNVGVFGAGESGSIGEVMSKAASQARLWPKQAHQALLLLFLFAFFVALNTAVGLLVIPQLLKMFFNIESVFSRSPGAILNTTVLAAIGALTYLAFDPLRKALYVVRCFRGRARESGEDLRVELKALKLKAGKVVLMFVFALGLPAMAAEETAAPPATTQVDPAELNASIGRVLERREYAWRMPRDQIDSQEKGWIGSFIDDSVNSLRKMLKMVREKATDIQRAIRKWFGKKDGSEEDDLASAGGFGIARPFFYAAIVLVVVAIVLLIRRIGWKKEAAADAAEAEAAQPDLESEDLVADQLPEEGWLKLARDLMAAGELRLALRASYLAGLAHLGTRQLLTIARYKSNHDYDRELRRRARQKEELVAAFQANMNAFERAWYGLHEVTAETLEIFNGNLERIRGC